jgi:hypothetical protein
LENVFHIKCFSPLRGVEDPGIHYEPFLDHFKGISQRFLHLRVARYEFLHNHGHLHWRQAFEAALRCIFSTTGDYLRRMAHQHRRMPLTLCYR